MFSTIKKIFFMKDVTPHINKFDLFVIMPATFILNILRSIADVLGATTFATAVDILAKKEAEPEIEGIIISPQILLYTTAGLYAYSRFSPYFVQLLVIPTRRRMTNNVIDAVIKKTYELSYEDAVNRKSLLEQALQYSREVSELASIIPGHIHQSVMSFMLGSAIVCWQYDYEVGGVFLGYVTIKTLSSFFAYYAIGAADKTRLANQEFRTFINRYKEAINNFDIIKTFDKEELEKKLAKKLSRVYIEPYISSIKKEAQAYLSIGILPIFADVGVIFYISTKQDFNLDELVFLLGFLAVVNTNSTRFVEACYRAFRLTTAYEEINKVFLLPSENHTQESSDEKWVKKVFQEGATINFDNVSFKYTSQSPLILKNVSFCINANQRYAIVGSSGSGKSTIAKLILRLYKPTAGKIMINDRDINTISLKHLYRIIGILTQDVRLFESDTVEFNIAYGFLNMNDQLEKIHANPEIYHFIEGEVEETSEDIAASIEMGTAPLLQDATKLAMSQEYFQAVANSQLNKFKPNAENGLPPKANILSVGEKHRVSLARLLLKHSGLFIFDEPTAALDSETESAVMETVKNCTNEKTSLMIAHRLNTIKDADKIIVLEQGEVREEGTHDELLVAKGRYYELWHIQNAH